MAFDFPSSPSDGQVFTPAGGPSYTYNAAGTKWLVSATTFTGQPLDALLTSIAALSMVADRYIYGTGTDAVTLGTVTSFARTLLAQTTATAVLTQLGISTGVYSPTITNTTNVSASTAFSTQYVVIGNRIIISGYAEADPVTASAFTEIQMTLPASPDFSAAAQGAGSGTWDSRASVAVFADATTDRMRLFWIPSGTANAGITFIFMYQVP